MENKPQVFQEIIEILQIHGNLSFWEKQSHKVDTHSTPLKREIIFRCFKGEQMTSALELTDIQECFEKSQASPIFTNDTDRSFTRRSTLNEIVCIN